MDEEAASAKKIDLEYLNSCLSVETAAEMMDSEDPKVETATKMAEDKLEEITATATKERDSEKVAADKKKTLGV